MNDNTRIVIIIILIICILIASFVNNSGLSDYWTFHNVYPRDYPLITEEDNYLSNDFCKNLSQRLLNHKLLGKQVLNREFKGTRGLLGTFNDSIIAEESFKKYDLDEIYAIFKNIKETNTNAFIFNILVIPPSKKDSKPIKIQKHFDCTMNVQDWLGRDYLPLSVSVLYLNLPKTFTKGRLNTYKFGGNKKDLYKAVMPVIGKKVRFRGDMYHGVEPIYTEEEVPRISLVFEQYILPKNKLLDKPFELDMADEKY